MTNDVKNNDVKMRTLTDAQRHVLVDHGTERPGSSPLNHEKRPGRFHCVGCGAPLFEAAAKFESGSGWPSFQHALPGAVETSTDTGHGMVRVEFHCARCGGHLGHIFPDGPGPGGQRYCTNGCALDFTPRKPD
jgi:peptide-methionine (R)-S-oxide reductase